MIEKTTVYVLECEHDKYYVGSTVNLKRRMKQHFHNSRSGSVWTKKHKPIRVCKIYRRIPYRHKLGFESQVTAELMWEKGINNVRGAMYLYARDYNAKDIDSLVSFLGHYNDLSYQYVRTQLLKKLAPRINDVVDNARSRRKEKRKNLQKEYKKNFEDLIIPKEIAYSQKKNKKRYGRVKPSDTNDEDDYNDTTRMDEKYKAMDEWLNRNMIGEEQESSSDEETDNNNEPKTVDDL